MQQRSGTRLVVGTLIGILLVAAAGSGYLLWRQRSTPSTSTAAHPSGGLTWVIAASALKHLETVDPSTSTISHFFDSPNVYVIAGQKSSGIPAGWQARSVKSFKSYADLKAAIDRNALAPSLAGILYDPEHWSFTPPEEQRDPARYIALAAALCRQHHLLLIATPAVDLTAVLAPGTSDPIASYLQLGIARDAARSADILVIQSQRVEDDAVRYQQFVTEAATQAKSVNPNVVVLAGLSTGPGGKSVTPQDLYQAYLSTRSVVSGYWLNIPGKGPLCPTCSDPRPDIALDFLKMIGQ